MKVIGITGSSGSGKTTVSNILKEKYNFEIIDADKVARELSKPGTEYLKEIKKRIGQDVFFEDNTLNRKALAQKIYTNSEDLKILNELTFKFVVDEIKKYIHEIREKKECECVIIDAPLLFESELDKECDEVIVLIADEKIKIARICKRDNITEEIAQKRLKIQQNDEFYTSKTKYIIKNNDEANLENNIDNILKEILKK